jgi:hypothetical protein
LNRVEELERPHLYLVHRAVGICWRLVPAKMVGLRGWFYFHSFSYITVYILRWLYLGFEVLNGV